MTSRSDIPMFELIGPPCESAGCDGVLIDFISWRKDEMYKECSKCKKHFYKTTMQEGLNHAVRTIKRVMKGEKPN